MKFTFDPKIKNGFYSSNYFLKAEKIVEKFLPNQTCCMQFTFFGDKEVKVCGIEESVQLLKFAINKDHLKKIRVYGMKDGDVVLPKQSVLLIFAPYQYIGRYENIIDGILARRSSICNNCYEILKIISPDKLLFMADRTDDYLLQPYDGYAAHIAGVLNFVSEAMISLIKNNKNVKSIGTMPHALIQQHAGNLNKTLENYIKIYGPDRAIALVDYHNDIEKEIQTLSQSYKHLYAVRVDTSSNLIDDGLLKQEGNKKQLYGVNHELIVFVKKALIKHGFKNTKIVASSALNLNKILEFKKKKTPIDFYGIGSSLITRNVHFTADLVLLNNNKEAKRGRELFTNVNKLHKYI